jgi:tetratricopeptide (TPR) repeat protein
LAGWVRLFQDGSDLWTWLLLWSGCSLSWLAQRYLYWQRFQRERIKQSELVGSDSAQPAISYTSKQRESLASIILLAMSFTTVVGHLVWDLTPPSKVLILVADFSGSDPEKYQVDNDIIAKLRWVANLYPEIEIQSLPITITEKQGSIFARSLGSQKKASVVVWGSYGVTSKAVRLGVHYEVLRPPKFQFKLEPQSEGQPQIFSVAEINSFKLQEQLSTEMTYTSLLIVGIAKYSEYNWLEAVQLFTDALIQMNGKLRAQQQEELAYFYRGNSLMYLSDSKNATVSYDQAIAFKMDYPKAISGCDSILSGRDKLIQAVKDYDQAIALNPNYWMALYNRGNAFLEMCSPMEAVKSYDRAIALKPDLLQAIFNRGNAFLELGKLAEAMKDYDRVIALKPDLPQAFNGRGLVFSAQGKLEKSVEEYSRAIALKPDYWEAISNIGFAEYESGQVQEAEKHWKQAVSLSAKIAEPRLALGVALYTNNNQEKGLALAEEAFMLDKHYANPEYLKRNLWGKKLLTDTVKLLNTPRIRAQLQHISSPVKDKKRD